MKVYITKYALTQGIFTAQVEETDIPSMVVDNSNNYRQYYHGKDWHRTREEALERAEEMRQKKIKSLQKSLKKMESLEFN